MERIIELAQRALTLDDSNAIAYMVLAELYGMQRQYDRAIAYDRRAIALDPNFPLTYYWFGDVLGWAGRPAEAISVEEQAMRLDPQNADQYALDIGWAYDLMGEYAKALPFLKRHAEHNPDNIFVHIELAKNYAWLGRIQEARAEAAEVMRLNPQFSLRSGNMPCPLKDQRVARAGWLPCAKRD
ncbi:MAG TPA: tetratricopeptide repeat protein [Candidatus Binataceae bacterium]|jgi:adenylate cyclase